MKGKRVLAGILLAGILAVTLTGCKNTDDSKKRNDRGQSVGCIGKTTQIKEIKIWIRAEKNYPYYVQVYSWF